MYGFISGMTDNDEISFCAFVIDHRIIQNRSCRLSFVEITPRQRTHSIPNSELRIPN